MRSKLIFAFSAIVLLAVVVFCMTPRFERINRMPFLYGGVVVEGTLTQGADLDIAEMHDDDGNVLLVRKRISTETFELNRRYFVPAIVEYSWKGGFEVVLVAQDNFRLP